MTLHYANNETNNQYSKKDVVTITFVGGMLTILYKDEAGKIQHLNYTKESLESGIISIF